MKKTLGFTAAAALLALWPASASAQTADEIIEKHLAASGGRAALAQLTSRSATGSITLSTPVGEMAGTIEVYNKAPNKTRTLIKLDLSAVGAGQVVSDQRFDGTTGYVIDSFAGNRDITGPQLEAMRNATFPSPLLNYKEHGATATLAEKQKVGDRDAYVIVLTPRAGPDARLFIDADSFLMVRSAITINVPQLGGDIEQVLEFSDFRDVDGIRVAYTTTSTNAVQTVKSTVTEMKHNVEIDDSSFSKPAAR
jgi:outer membrane lipoprotein-sorting protein